KVSNYESNWLSDFFTATDENGNFTRAIAPYRPIYFAGFIQDKFSFEDLVFNIGLRIDRFDANQSVLADPWSIFPTVKAGEDLSSYIDSDGDIALPTNIGDDYVVYVNDVQNPTSIVGFRDGDTWFNAEGSEIQDASVLETATGIAPLLVDNTRTRGQDIDASSFKDYKPQVRVMPRIAFSFPISDEATFIAHYDVLTKRPTSGARLNPIDYYFIESVGGNAISHGNLLPEQTIDYEVGFKQKLTPYSAITLSGFYREMRDMVNVVNLAQAYPNPYITYNNQDFGTVKGMTFTYDLRPEGNFSGRVSYTLQFAEGTGSNSTSGLGLARTGQANLRATIPLSFDQRHTINGNFDYRYGGGKNYNGPVIGGKDDGTGGVRLLENLGINVTVNAGSGTPYTASSNVSSSGLFTGPRQLVDGSLNGNRLPWQFVFDAGIDRNFDLRFGGEDSKKLADAKVYFQIDNLLNTLNIASVYRFTGNPDDDGYLTDATFQNDITSQTDEQAFRELYNIKINNGSMFTLPRRVKIGIRLNF
ncbi:MAG: hypothetical protein MRY83_03835, partial [Flavobacteriales bacterium]|nr:hypothetical protein [Flavobacteriales bacterium]